MASTTKYTKGGCPIWAASFSITNAVQLVILKDIFTDNRN